MSESLSYVQLLDAAIEYLQDLKRHGVRYVHASTEALQQLTRSAAWKGKSGPARSPAGAVRPAAEPTQKAVQALEQPSPRLEREVGMEEAATPEREAKARAMTRLRERALTCQKCPHLAQSRRQVVFGVGDIHSPLMFVGEAPGADEDRQGEPFVGRAGELLTRIIVTMGLSRDRVYIANILKCRPDTPGQSTGNRKPTLEEMKTCLPYLEEQIDLIQPRVLVALGATAVEGLLGKTMGITRLRGTWQTYRNIPLMPTFHPSFLLRSQSWAEKRKVWEDMMLVMEKLGLPISSKQRGYFLGNGR